jgi:hypothetical protein
MKLKLLNTKPYLPSLLFLKSTVESTIFTTISLSTAFEPTIPRNIFCSQLPPLLLID